MATVRVTAAGPDDLDAVVALLRARDDQPWAREAVQRWVGGLTPEGFRAHLAWVDDTPAGLTGIYPRTLRWGDRQLQAGYFAHLYVRPEHRRLMLYPRLVLAMLKAAEAAGCEVVFTGTRQPVVAEAHQKLGFTLVGTLPVQVKPLRLGTLVAKHKAWPAATRPAAAVVDLAWRATGSLRPVSPPSGVVLDTVAPAAVAGPCCDFLAAAGAGRISQCWTVEGFARRFRPALDEQPYHVIRARQGEALVGAVLYRLAERGNHILAGVILDLWTTPDQLALRPVLLRAAERAMALAGGEVVMDLESAAGLWPGYRRSDERYHLLVWPPAMATEPSPGAALANWRFAFADHDAF